MLRASLRPLAAAGLLLATGEPHAQVVRVSPEFRVNTYTTSYQDRPVVAKAGSGNFVVAWESYRQDGSFSGVFARSFNSDRGALGPAFRVNSYTSSYQSYPDVAADTAGNFVVVWQSYRQDGSYYGVFGQRYDTTPAALASEFRVNGYTNYDQNRTSVARGPAGKIVVVWQDASRDGDGLSVYGQRYDSAGVAQGSAFRVNTYTTSSQGYPDIDADGTGNFVVVWQSYLQDGSDQGIFGQRYLGNATKNGTEFRANTYTLGTQQNPSIAVRTNGAFVVAWESPQDGSGLGIFGQRYKNDGTKNGGEFQVNTYTTNDQRNPSVAIDGNGNFVVVWDSLGQDGSLQGIYAQRYNSDGTTRGAEFRVNTYTTSTQSSPSVAMDGTGAFVVVWQSFGQDGDEYGVFGQRFNIVDCPALSVTAPAPASQTTCEGGSATFSVSATGTVPIAYQWRKNGVNLDDGTFIFGSHAPTMTIHQMSSVDQGNYDCVVTDYCLPARTLTSSTAVLNFNASQSLGAVQTLGVQKVNGGASLKFNWTNISGAVDYVVLEDTVPSGPFFTTTGSAVNGADGLTVAVGTGTKFYLVAGRNAACGIGPRD